MLVLTRKKSQSLVVGDAVVRILDVRGESVRVGIEAPGDVNVRRSELPPTIDFSAKARPRRRGEDAIDEAAGNDAPATGPGKETDDAA